MTHSYSKLLFRQNFSFSDSLCSTATAVQYGCFSIPRAATATAGLLWATERIYRYRGINAIKLMLSPSALKIVPDYFEYHQDNGAIFNAEAQRSFKVRKR